MTNYNGEGLTPKQFCKIVNIALGTFYNNRALIEGRGIKLVHGSKDVSTRQTIKVTDKNLNTVRFTISLYRLVVNHLNLAASIQVPYTGVNDKLFKVEGNLSPKEAIKFIEKALTREELTQQDRYNGSSLLIDLARHVRIRVSDETSSQIAKSFESLYGFTPEREQLEVVYMMYKSLTKSDLRMSFVQALAGTSKTTCINVLKHFMKTYHNLEVKTVSYTQLASRELKGGTTLHSLLKNCLKIDVVNTPEDEILSTAQMYGYLNKTKPVKMLVIDECTTLSNQILSAAAALSENIVFVGDKNQFRNNSAFLGPRIGSLTTQYRFLNSESSLQVDITQAMLRRDTKKIKELLSSVTEGYFTAKVKTKRTSLGSENYTDYSNSFNEHLGLLEQYSDKNSIILAYSKDACNHINKLLGGETIKQGDKVLLTTTLYKPSLVPSGSFGRVMSVSGTMCKVLFDEGVFEVNLDELSLGYAVTSLKSQGSAWNNVLFVEGTSPVTNKLEDGYVCPTRSRVKVRVLSRTSVNTTELGIHCIHDMSEGTRNNNLFTALTSVNEIALDSGLDSEEIAKVASAAFKTKVKSTKTCNKKISVKSHSVSPITKNYGFVLITGYDEKGKERKWHPNGEQCVQTKAEAQYKLDQYLKTGKYVTGYVTRDLHNIDEIVIDCDTKEMVEVFSKYKDITLASVSKEGDKMHLTFKTDKLFPRVIGTKDKRKADLIGNNTRSLQNLKSNKISNNKEVAYLTPEIEQHIREVFGL